MIIGCQARNKIMSHNNCKIKKIKQTMRKVGVRILNGTNLEQIYNKKRITYRRILDQAEEIIINQFRIIIKGKNRK